MSDLALDAFGGARPMYYRRDGSPMTSDEMHADMTNIWSEESRRVGLDTVTFRGQKFDISTVHLVIDHAYIGPPLIFETMIFSNGSNHDEYMRRYSTEADALAGHQYIVNALSRGELPNPDHQALER